MTDKIKVNAVSRAGQPAAKAVVAAELYGSGIANQHLYLEATELDKVLARINQATLLDLIIDGQAAVPVLIKEIQRDPVKGRVLHLDFLQINPQQKVVVEIDVEPTGKSLAISNLGATLVKNRQTLKIECLPKDLIAKIAVDLTKLATMDDVIRVEDLVLPAGVTAKGGLRDPIFSVLPPRKEKIEVPAVEAAAAAAEAAPAEGAPAEEKKEGENVKK
jgi:large subunit ribosomal protein L25